MEFLFIMILFPLVFLTGFQTHKMLSINYKNRWQEALALLKEEKLGTNDLHELESGEIINTKYSIGCEFKLKSQYGFRKLSDKQRLELETDRLRQGLPPADAFGGCTPDGWTKGRKMQLRYGWEYDYVGNHGSYTKIK